MPKQRPVSEQERALSRVVKALLLQRIELDPWLEFAQSTWTFRFGETKKPLPIGALFRLWETDERWHKPCPFCGSKAYGISCGGLLSMGWFEFICLECSRFFVQNPAVCGPQRSC